jgi:hypothetical protein
MSIVAFEVALLLSFCVRITMQYIVTGLEESVSLYDWDAHSCVWSVADGNEPTPKMFSIYIKIPDARVVVLTF